VAFTNVPYAGVYQLKKDAWSVFETQDHADPDNTYVDTLQFSKVREPGKDEVHRFLEDDAYLVFRTRVKTDAKGKLVSAHYGVIHGPWNFDDQTMSIPVRRIHSERKSQMWRYEL